MVQTTNRFFDEVARLMNDAAGVAQGVRREFDTLVRAQAERFLRDMDLVKREEFEAVKEMARLAREENEALKSRVAALEASRPGAAAKASPRPAPPAPASPPSSSTPKGAGPAAATPSAGIPPSPGNPSQGDHPINLDAPVLPEK
jgi:BMFP domain-containing protein YqiC